MKKTRLNIISEQYPYGNGEQFFHLEIIELSKYFDEIVIFPIAKLELSRSLPGNVFVDDGLNKEKETSSVHYLARNFWMLIRFYLIEFKNTKQKRYLLKTSRTFFDKIIKAKIKSGRITIDKKNDNYYYSFWMNQGALILSILKFEKSINRFVFRVNGFDIFDERHEGNYMPLKQVNYKYAEKIIVLSNPALTYLKNKSNHQEKLVLNHYGIYETGFNQIERKDEYHIVSCSNLISLKRVDKIILALSNVSLPIRWTHFGDGPLYNYLLNEANKLPNNIKVEFKGNTKQLDILNFYQSKSIDLFIHTSETEGLGMSIIEAQSYGIPAVVIGVGGVVDIVSENTGVVLNNTASNDDIVKAILSVLGNEKYNNEYRKKIATFTLEKFSAENNYKNLSEIIKANSYD